MIHVRTFVLPHYPAHEAYIALFTNVANAPFLRQQLLDGNPEYDYAFIDAETVRSHMVSLAPILSSHALHSSHHAAILSCALH